MSHSRNHLHSNAEFSACVFMRNESPINTALDFESLFKMVVETNIASLPGCSKAIYNAMYNAKSALSNLSIELRREEEEALVRELDQKRKIVYDLESRLDQNS